MSEDKRKLDKETRDKVKNPRSKKTTEDDKGERLGSAEREHKKGRAQRICLQEELVNR